MNNLPANAGEAGDADSRKIPCIKEMAAHFSILA